MSEFDTEKIRAKAMAIVVLGEGMQAREFFGALAIAAAQSLKVMCPPETLRQTIQWYATEVARMALDKTH